MAYLISHFATSRSLPHIGGVGRSGKTIPVFGLFRELRENGKCLHEVSAQLILGVSNASIT